MSTFTFKEQHFLTRPLGLRAHDLPSLLRLIRGAPDASIFCHVHFSRLRPRVQRSGLLNNFASWVLNVLGERLLSERLAMIDGATSSDLGEVRRALVDIVSAHGGQMEHGPHALPGREFYLCALEGDVVVAGVEANDPAGLAAGLARVSDQSLVHHAHAYPLRGQSSDDISRWLADNGHDTLAERMRALPTWTIPLDAYREQACAVLRGGK